MASGSSPSSSASPSFPSGSSLTPGASSLTPGAAPKDAAASDTPVVQARLDNGLEIVVIPDHRAPVVTHMIWYRNGSADDPVGKSGIAHFLEHLMFKGTRDNPQGKFTNLVSDLGGQENAFTSNDYTAYFQRIAKEHLAVCMEYEADRMKNLVLTDEVVAPERDVVLEERRMRTDSDPSEILDEAVQAAVYSSHPYGHPIIGWNHEIETLDRTDAFNYYERFYTPENAILIIAGDVDPEAAIDLARKFYGPIPPFGAPPVRVRPREPEPKTHRLVTLSDEKVEQPRYQSVHLVPSYRTGTPGEAEALEVLGFLLGGGQSSLLFTTLVMDEKIAVAAGAYYMGTALDDTRFFVYAIPVPGVSLEQLEHRITALIEGLTTEGFSEAALTRAKTRLVAEAIYARDSQTTLANWYGASLATGMTLADIAAWPDRIEAVTAAQVVDALRYLDNRKAVAGYLLPAEAA
jgi:zinc protease